MPSKPKTEQLQIRIGTAEKRELLRRAKAAGMSLSSYILKKAIPPKEDVFQHILEQLAVAPEQSFALASLSDFLATLSASEFCDVLLPPRRARLSPFLYAYVAAMVEHVASRKNALVPTWVLNAPGVERPWFASELRGLRLHLLTTSPAAFRRRNLFVDASVGERI
ncbi:MAG: hypothetical protein SFV15_00720 [Polyangiaceae bacterium]|nr:hypothetical protein [Polyangiaceae bacterium]